MGGLLTLVMYAAAPVINAYFIAKHEGDMLLWVALCLYIIAVASCGSWMSTRHDIYRALAILLFVAQGGVVGCCWVAMFPQLSSTDNYLLVVFITSLLVHVAALLLLDLRAETPKTSLKETLLPREEKEGLPIKVSGT